MKHTSAEQCKDYADLVLSLAEELAGEIYYDILDFNLEKDSLSDLSYKIGAIQIKIRASLDILDRTQYAIGQALLGHTDFDMGKPQ